MNKSRIAAVAAAILLGALILLAAPAKAPMGPAFGWVAVTILLVGAVLTIREHLADRAERRRGIQVLGTFLSDEDGEIR